MVVYSYFNGYKPIGMDLTHQLSLARVGIWRYNFAGRAYAHVSVWTLPFNLVENHTNWRYNIKISVYKNILAGNSWLACLLSVFFKYLSKTHIFAMIQTRNIGSCLILILDIPCVRVAGGTVNLVASSYCVDQEACCLVKHHTNWRASDARQNDIPP